MSKKVLNGKKTKIKRQEKQKKPEQKYVFIPTHQYLKLSNSNMILLRRDCGNWHISIKELKLFLKMKEKKVANQIDLSLKAD